MSIALQTLSPLEGEQTILWSPENGRIPLRDGSDLDVTGRHWTTQTATKLFSIDWDDLKVPEGNIRNAIRRWIAHLFHVQSPTATSNAFRQAQHLFHTSAFMEAAANSAVVPYLAFSQAQEALSPEDRWQLHYCRSFYRWCLSQRFPNFCPDVARRLDGLVIGGNRKGQAVRSADPDKGPLDAMEVVE